MNKQKLSQVELLSITGGDVSTQAIASVCLEMINTAGQHARFCDLDLDVIGKPIGDVSEGDLGAVRGRAEVKATAKGKLDGYDSVTSEVASNTELSTL